MLRGNLLVSNKFTTKIAHLFLIGTAALDGDIEPIFAAMCIPLILQNQIIGVFGAINTKNKSPFLLAHRRLLYVPPFAYCINFNQITYHNCSEKQ